MPSQMREKHMSALRILVLAVLLFCAPLVSVQAQVLPTGGSEEAGEVTVPEDLSAGTVRDLVSRLSDRQVRQLLLERLDALAEARHESGEDIGPIDFVTRLSRDVGLSISHALGNLPGLVETQSGSFAAFYADRGAGGMGRFLGLTLAAVLAGLLAAWLTGRAAYRWQDQIDAATGEESLGRLLRLQFLRLTLDLSSLIAFVIVGATVIELTLPASDIPFAELVLFALIALPMAMAAISRFLIRPYRAELRMVHTDDATARYLHRHQILLALFIGLQVAVIDFNQRNGVPVGELRLGFWLNLGIFAYIAYICYRARDGLSLMLRGPDDDVTPTEARVARAYPYAAIVACVLVWLLVEILVAQKMFHLLVDGQHYLTLFLLLMAPALDTMIRGLVRHLAPPMRGEGPLAEAAYRATRRSYIRIGRALVCALVVIAIAAIWEIDFHNLASAGIGARAAAALIEMLIILGIGFLVYELVTLWVNRKLADEQTAAGFDLNAEEPGGGEGGGAGGSRLATVLPLMRWVLQSTIVVITVLLALGNVGIDITPLLAGAGIVGLAIGFGAQKLVSDVVSGIFFLVDDAFRTGEYVEIEGTLGTVENISIRSLQLRHHRGPVHTIPFGEIPKITNYSRDWVIMKMRFTVPFDTDLKQVKNIFKQIGKDMMAVPEFAEDMMQPFKSQGVLEVDDVGIVVRGKFMAKPGKQFTLRKEIYQRVQKAFEENGIEFARREVRVRLNGDEPAGGLSEVDRQSLAAAAAEAAGATAPATEPST